MNGRRLSVRDYKRPRRGGLSFEGTWTRPFALGLAGGLALGLAVAAAVFLADHRPARTGVTAAAAPDVIGHTAFGARTGLHAGESHAGARGAADATAGAASSADKSAFATSTSGGATGSAAGTGLAKYDFYQMLPRSQVLVSGRESGTPLPAGAQVNRPGVYFLQIGSYRDAAIADRMRVQAQKLGVTASIQRIVVDATTWHRVRVGPIRDLAVLNRVRRQLQAGNLDAMVVRVSP